MIPEWLEKIRDSLLRARDSGIKFIRSEYYRNGAMCTVGWLAKEAGCDIEVLKNGGGEIITAVGPSRDDCKACLREPPPWRCRFHDYKTQRADAVTTMRQAIVDHFDGEAPEDVIQSVRAIQMANDGGPRLVPDKETPLERAIRFIEQELIPEYEETTV